MTPISAGSAPERAPGVVGAATPPLSWRSKLPRRDGLYTPACKLSGGSKPSKPNGYAPVSRLGRPSSATAGNGFVVLRGSRVSPTSAMSRAPTASPPDTPPSAGQIPCSPTSKTASWPRTAPSRPNIYLATSAPSPGASTAASSSKQSTSDWPSPPWRPRQCPIASSNWLRLDGKREPKKENKMSAYRQIKPYPMAGVTPAADISGKPKFEWVDPQELLVEDKYQRNIGEKSVKLIRHMVANWEWSRMKPP